MPITTDLATTEPSALSSPLERVMHQVLAMKQAGDMDHLIREVWDVLVALDFDFVSCAFLLMEEERDWLTSYNVWEEVQVAELYGATALSPHARRLENGLIIFSGQTPLHKAPALYDDAIAAWRQGTVERHPLSATEIGEIIRLNTQRYGGPSARVYPIRFHLHIPFAYGVFTLRSRHDAVDQFSKTQIDFLKRLVEILSVGHTRYREFLTLERDRTVQRLRAEVQAMQQGNDIIDLMGRLWEELHRAGIEFQYMSIAVSDGEEDCVHLYAAASGKLRDTFDLTPLLKKDIVKGVNLLYRLVPLPIWQQNHTDFIGVRRVENQEIATYLERTRQLWQVEGYRYAAHSLTLMTATLPQGRIVVMQGQMTAQDPPVDFTPEDQDILETFAEALGLGFTRFFDFQRLERHNRDLEIRQAVDRLRTEVAAMRQSSDIADVAVLLGHQLSELGLEFFSSSFGVVNEETGMVHLYAVVSSELFESFDTEGSAYTTADRSIIGELDYLDDIEGPVFIEETIPGFTFAYSREALEGSPVAENDPSPRLVHRNEVEVQQVLGRFRRNWAPDYPLKKVPRSAIRVPFSHGSIAIAHLEPGRFTQRDVNLVAAYADAISLGFTRFHDFQRLERHNRELEIERAVGRVQIAVQNMKTSTDIVPIITLFTMELEHLGLDNTWCTINIIDREADKVRVYGTIGAGQLSGKSQIWAKLIGDSGHQALSFSAATMERVENEEGPFYISGIPGSQIEYASYLSRPLDSYHGRLQQTKETIRISRSDAELHDACQEYKRRWKVDNWPEELMLRSILRTPFSGGTIALSDPGANPFNERDARILERFAEAFSLGYTRYLDFRRLEEQNRALEAASRIKSEFLANMSHELRTPMNAIINFSAMVLEGICGEISDDVRDVVGEIDQNGENLLALINDVLDLSKIEAGAMQLERAPCDPVECVENAVAALEHSAGEKELELSVQVEDLPPILADERRLTQHVLINLIKNAIKFTPAGKITVGVRRENGDVLFRVKDTGIGIPAAEQERIFETFHQVDGSITRQAEGTGLGLAIARKFVELHRGRIWVESEEGRGSTFYVAVPLKG